jgi:hypothetical protein
MYRPSIIFLTYFFSRLLSITVLKCGSKMEQSLFHLHIFSNVPGGYKYGDLALQVGGVSDETVKYGREFCGASTQE